MAYAVILTLDRKLDSEVRQLWADLEVAGIGKTPGQFAEPPHITFSVFPTGDPEKLAELVDSISVASSEVRLIPVGTFPGETHVLYHTALLSEELLQAHAEHHDILRREKIKHDPLYSPDNIIFHCTLAVDVEDQQLLNGITICRKDRNILDGFAERIELIEFFPVRVIHSRQLKTG